MSLFATIQDARLGTATHAATTRQLASAPELFRHLCLRKRLQGHRGCVNRLCWNDAGTLLASASDDCTVCLWNPFGGDGPVARIATGHSMNIFGVRFMPMSGDALVATGAMDAEVRVSDVDRGPIHCYNAHRGRVKAVEVVPGDAHALLSGSEDGTVRLFDIRSPPTSAANKENVIVNLKRAHVQVKTLAVCRHQPHLLAVGGTDCFVRLYDLRAISREEPAYHLSRAQLPNEADRQGLGGDRGPLALFSPACLAQSASPQHRCFVTHVGFSNSGREIVATYHGDCGERVREPCAPRDPHAPPASVHLFPGWQRRHTGSRRICLAPWQRAMAWGDSGAAPAAARRASALARSGDVRAGGRGSAALAARSSAGGGADGLCLRAGRAYAGPPQCVRAAARAPSCPTHAHSCWRAAALCTARLSRAEALLRRKDPSDLHYAVLDCDWVLQHMPGDMGAVMVKLKARCSSSHHPALH